MVVEASSSNRENDAQMGRLHSESIIQERTKSGLNVLYISITQQYYSEAMRQETLMAAHGKSKDAASYLSILVLRR